ncbi:MAG: spermidine/putrescine ABC transporter substrate-binding protein, partial [Oscillospiraceae bacterium]|nr:spermidine/putrescine ABC transporter substrate-binding protein [Oscillospiraceae bacterium]
NYKYIMEEYKNLEFDPQNEYSVPYTWGTVVLIYNKKFVTEPEDGWSWDVLWDEAYKGKTIMFDNSRDAFGISLKRLGYSLNTTDIRELEHAADELVKQSELVQGYFMDEMFLKMEGEDAWVAPYYAGDAVMMIDVNPNLDAAFPKEGTNFFVDSMCIPKGAKNKESAEKFIDFLCRPENAAVNSEAIGYATPNSEAMELIDEELAENEIIYPDSEILENTEVFLNLPEEVNMKLDELWIEVRGASSDKPWLFPAILGVAVVLVIVLMVARKKKKKQG